MQQYGFPKLHFFFQIFEYYQNYRGFLGFQEFWHLEYIINVFGYHFFDFHQVFPLDFGFLDTYPNNISLGVYYVKEIDPEENNVSVLKRLHLSTTSDLFIQSMSKQLQYSMYSKKKYYPWPLLSVVLAVCWANTVLKGASRWGTLFFTL